MKRPQLVYWAIALLGLSFVFDLVIEFVATIAMFGNEPAFAAGRLVWPVGFFLVKLWLLYFAFHGRNWARIGLFVIVALGVAIKAMLLGGPLGPLLVSSALPSLVQVVIEVICVILLLLAGSYFSQRGLAPNKSL